MSGQASVQMRVDLGGSDGIPHTFIAITHPDGTQTEYGLVPATPMSPEGPGNIDVTGPNSPKGEPHEWSVAGPEQPLTDPQYRDLMRDIENSIQSPPDYILPGSWWPGNDGTNCTGWAVNIWNKNGLPEQFGVTNTWRWTPWDQGLWIKLHDIWELVMQTRLKPYLDQIELVIDATGLRLDATQLNQRLTDKKAADPENFLADLLDLDRYAGGFLSGTNWSGLADFDSLVETLPQTAAITAQKSRRWRDGNGCANEEWRVAA